jgi:hypothetical protein
MTEPRARGSLWARHEQFFLYAIAAVTYITLGVFLQTFVLNWVVGPLYLLLVVWIIPDWIRGVRLRRHEQRATAHRAESGPP